MRYPYALIVALLLLSDALAQDKKAEPEAQPKLGEKFQPKDIDLARPVYETSFDSPDVLKDWRLEGGKRS